MSIVNVFVSPESALVGVDTEGQTPDGFVECGKVIYLPHLNAVIANRGVTFTIGLLMPMVMAFDGGFDALADAMPDIVNDVIRHMKAAGLHNKMHDIDAELADFILVGYSPKAGRMIGNAYTSHPGRSVEVHKDFPQFYAPFFGIEAIQKLDIVADRSGMLALAMDQCRRSRETGIKGATAGGRFFITEITKDRISVEQAGMLPDRTSI